MAGVKGRSGGARVGSGRKSLKDEYEIKYELQKHLPKAYRLIELALADGKNTNDAWKLLDKFIGDRKVSELVGDDGGPIQIEIIKDLNNNNNE